MTPSLVNAGAIGLSVCACWIVVVAPGLALARIFFPDRDGRQGPGDRAGAPSAVVAGLAILPLIDSLSIRGFGLDAALAINLALAAYAGVAAVQAGVPRRWTAPSRLAILLSCGWLLVLILESVDLEVAGRLYQPFTVIDMVKHAATTQAIMDSGAPPRDPFFLRPERVGYYYFFYAPAALIERFGLSALDARTAVCGLAFWTGIGVHGLLRLALERCGRPAGAAGAGLLVCVAVLAAGGLDIIGFLRMGLLQGTWLADPLAWNEQITGWTESLLWVPHHVVGLIAAIVGLIAISEAASPEARAGSPGSSNRSIVLAALCFASTFGLSTWVTLALVCTVAVWLGLLCVERRWSAVFCGLAAGVLALALAAPQIWDVLAGRVATGTPLIVPTVRVFSPVESLVPAGVWRLVARAVALPVNYFASFGVLASGALLYWGERQPGPRFPTEFARCLAIAALVGLILGGFLKSTLMNNDLGWRVTLFPLFAGTVWTVLAIERRLAVGSLKGWRAWRSLPSATITLLVLGWSTTLCGLVSLRAYPLMPIEADHRFLAAHPQTDRALRLAYEWADHHLDPKAVLQHDPTRPRAVAFALYGRHGVAVADSFGSLFGADPKAVDTRILALAPIFRAPLGQADLQRRLAASGIDDLVVTKDDPVWAMPDAFLWTVAPVYASDAVRIVSSASLDAGSRISASATSPTPPTRDN